jgi:hypothetical protein
MVDGTRFSFEIDPAEVEAVVARARAVLDGFDMSVSRGCALQD